MNLSKEHLDIFNHLNLNKNVSVNSCAGCGKTTTIVEIVKSCQNKLILILTYSKILRKEIKEKLEKEEINKEYKERKNN